MSIVGRATECEVLPLAKAAPLRRIAERSDPQVERLSKFAGHLNNCAAAVFCWVACFVVLARCVVSVQHSRNLVDRYSVNLCDPGGLAICTLKQHKMGVSTPVNHRSPGVI